MRSAYLLKVPNHMIRSSSELSLQGFASLLPPTAGCNRDQCDDETQGWDTTSKSVHHKVGRIFASERARIYACGGASINQPGAQITSGKVSNFRPTRHATSAWPDPKTIETMVRITSLIEQKEQPLSGPQFTSRRSGRCKRSTVIP